MSNPTEILFTCSDPDFTLIHDAENDYYSFGETDSAWGFPVNSSCLDAMEAHRELIRQKEIYDAPTASEATNPVMCARRLMVVQAYRDMLAAVPLSPDQFAAIYAPAL